MNQAVGSKDSDKNMLLIYSPTVKHQSLRMMLAVACSIRFPFYVREISQAYVSKNTSLLRDIFFWAHPKSYILTQRSFSSSESPCIAYPWVEYTCSRPILLMIKTSSECAIRSGKPSSWSARTQQRRLTGSCVFNLTIAWAPYPNSSFKI